MASGSILFVHDGFPLSGGIQYRSIMDALQYYTIMHPDIAFTVNKVCQFMHSPTYVHWQDVKCLLRYLKGIAHFGILLQPSPIYNLVYYTDAD